MNFHVSDCIPAAMLAVLGLSAPAAAQSSVEPGSIERTVPRIEAERRVTQPAVMVTAPEGLRGADISGSFVLGAVSVEGATALSSADLAQDFEPMLASRVTGEQLGTIVDRITKRYRAAGYPFSYAVLPEQDVRSGIVRISVVEGFVSEVRIEGVGKSEGALRALAGPLLEDRPLRKTTLERVLGLIGDLPGIVVSDVQISREPGDPGRLLMTIVASHDPAHSLLYSDNRGPNDGARQRLYSSAAVASVLTSGDKVQVDLFGIPGDGYHLLYGQADVSLPLIRDGLRAGLAGSASDDGQRLAGQTYSGSSRNFAGYLSYPVLRTRTATAIGRLAINDWRNDAKLDGMLAQRDRLRVARASINLKRLGTTRIDAELAASKGLGFSDGTRKGDPLASRPGASSEFTKANLDIQVARPISERVTLRVAVAGQYAGRPLLSVEEFALGGSRFGRAYDYNSQTGEDGFAGAFELGYRVGDIAGGPRQLEIFGSIDGGAVFRSNPATGVSGDDDLVGLTGGARFSVFGVTSSFELGAPLKRSGQNSGVHAFVSIAKAL